MKTGIEIFASVTIDDRFERRDFVELLSHFGIRAKESENRIEFSYYGSRDVISRLMTICEGYPAHSVHVTAVGK